MSEKEKFNILFLCNGNAARSIFAEYITRDLGSDQFEVYSAGTNPGDQVHPLTLSTLENRLHLGTDGARCKSWQEHVDAGIDFDFVITVCDLAKENCPTWPDQPVVAHWNAPDPRAFDGTEEEKARHFYQVAMLLRRRIELFCSLPFEKLDKLRIEQMTREIADQTELQDEA